MRSVGIAAWCVVFVLGTVAVARAADQGTANGIVVEKEINLDDADAVRINVTVKSEGVWRATFVATPENRDAFTAAAKLRLGEKVSIGWVKQEEDLVIREVVSHGIDPAERERLQDVRRREEGEGRDRAEQREREQVERAEVRERDAREPDRRVEGEREGVKRVEVRREGDRDGVKREEVRREGDREGAKRVEVRREGDREGVKREEVRREGDREGVKRVEVRREGERKPAEREEAGRREDVKREEPRREGDREGAGRGSARGVVASLEDERNAEGKVTLVVTLTAEGGKGDAYRVGEGNRQAFDRAKTLKRGDRVVIGWFEGDGHKWIREVGKMEEKRDGTKEGNREDGVREGAREREGVKERDKETVNKEREERKLREDLERFLKETEKKD